MKLKHIQSRLERRSGALSQPPSWLNTAGVLQNIDCTLDHSSLSVISHVDITATLLSIICSLWSIEGLMIGDNERLLSAVKRTWADWLKQSLATSAQQRLFFFALLLFISCHFFLLISSSAFDPALFYSLKSSPHNVQFMVHSFSLFILVALCAVCKPFCKKPAAQK